MRPKPLCRWPGCRGGPHPANENSGLCGTARSRWSRLYGERPVTPETPLRDLQDATADWALFMEQPRYRRRDWTPLAHPRTEAPTEDRCETPAPLPLEAENARLAALVEELQEKLSAETAEVLSLTEALDEANRRAQDRGRGVAFRVAAAVVEGGDVRISLVGQSPLPLVMGGTVRLVPAE